MDDAREAMEAAERAAGANAEVRPVTIDNDIVTRPASEVSETVHSYLSHVRGKGLRCVPEPITIRDGVETLRYVDGASGGDGWYHQHTEQDSSPPLGCCAQSMTPGAIGLRLRRLFGARYQ